MTTFEEIQALKNQIHELETKMNNFMSLMTTYTQLQRQIIEDCMEPDALDPKDIQ